MATKRNHKYRILLLIISVIISLLFAEKILDRYFPQNTYSRAYNGANDCFAKSDFTVFTLKANCTMPFHDYDTGEKFTARINNLGYRGGDFPIQKGSSEKRILVLGDSFILGFGVKDQNLVTTKLEEKLNNTNLVNSLKDAKVINAGYAGGFGPDGYFLHLKKYGTQLSPDLVVFSVFVGNDFSDMANSEWIGTGEYGEPDKVVSKNTFVDNQGRLVPISIPLIYKIPILKDSNLAVLSSRILTDIVTSAIHFYERIKFKIFPPTFPTADARDSNLPGEYISRCLFGERCHRQTMHLYSDLLSVIKASNKLVSDATNNSPPHFVVLLIPADFQLYPGAYKKYNDQGILADQPTLENPNPQRRVKEMLDKENIPYIDLLPVMRANPDRLFFQNDGHWNAKGHELAAEEIYKWIAANYK